MGLLWLAGILVLVSLFVGGVSLLYYGEEKTLRTGPGHYDEYNPPRDREVHA